MAQERINTTTSRLYEIVHHVLRDHILSGKLPSGLVLLEQPIADAFSVSRAPVKKALKMLNEEGLIERFDGRGFIISAKEGNIQPLRLNILEAGLDITEHIGEEVISSSAWERIYAQTEHEVGGFLAFGRFRVHEARLGDYFCVSRTVARDVLGRMHERGLIEKTPRSHWIAGPLTAKSMRDYYEIRRMLEPGVLVAAAPRLKAAELKEMKLRLADLQGRDPAQIGAEELGDIETDLHVTCLERVDNPHLVGMVRRAQIPLIIKQTFLKYLGIPEVLPELVEHRLVLEHLLHGQLAAASVSLEAHLRAALERMLSRLKVFSVVPTPELPPYLMPVEP